MKRLQNIFIKIDDFIFKKIDLLKADGSFQKFNELLVGLEEDQQKIFAQVFTFSLLFLPYLFVLTLWWGNHKTKANLELKGQILEQIASLTGNKEALNSVSSTYVSPNPIMGQEDLDNKVRNLMSASAIDQNKVRIISFNQLSTSNSIAKIETVLNFQNFGTLDFSNFMRSLVEQEKFKIIRINLTKDLTSNLLQGDVSLMHLGKNSTY